MKENRILPSYQKPSDLTGEIVIETFSDGGVTITALPRGVVQSRELIRAIIIVVAIAGGLFAAGARPWQLPTMLVMVMKGLGSAEAAFIIIFVPLTLLIVLRILRMRNPRGPTVLGIGLKSVFIRKPGALIQREFEAPRSALRKIRIGRFRRSMNHRIRCIIVQVDGHFPVSLFADRNEKELDEMAKAALKALQTTRAI